RASWPRPRRGVKRWLCYDEPKKRAGTESPLYFFDHRPRSGQVDVQRRFRLQVGDDVLDGARLVQSRVGVEDVRAGAAGELIDGVIREYRLARAIGDQVIGCRSVLHRGEPARVAGAAVPDPLQG